MKRLQIEAELKQLIKNNLIKTITNYDKLVTAILERKAVYCGFDPTSTSLHIGHFLPIYLLQKFAHWKCPVIVVIGGLTGTIGDPSFRQKRRQTTNSTDLLKNSAQITAQIKRLLPNCQIRNNCDWYQNWSVAAFFQTLGKAFTVNKILEKKSITQFHEQKDLFYAEFSYLLLQAYDFYYLYQNANCAIQIGGSDQYPNITLGLDLIQKLLPNEEVSSATGLTTALITKNGHKMSKSQNNYLALDLNLSSLYDYYHFFNNLNDVDLTHWINWLNLPQNAPDVQKHLLFNRELHNQVAAIVVEQLFGTATKNKFQQLVAVLKPNTALTKSWPILRNHLPVCELQKATSLKTIILTKKIMPSATVFKRCVQEKSLKLNQTIVTDWNYTINPSAQEQKIIVTKGKTHVLLIRVLSQ